MSIRYLVVFLFLFAFHTSKAQESMLPEVSYEYLDKLVATARANYPKMKAYDRSIYIAKLNVQKANLDWLNILSFIYLYSPTNTSNPGVANTSILSGFQAGFSLSIGSILQKPGQIKAAKEELKIVRLSQEEYNLSLEAIVQQRYFTYVQAHTLLNWKIKDVQNIESRLKDVKYKFEKAEMSFADYNSALSAYSSGMQSKIQAEGAYLMAKSALEEMIGVKLETIK